MIYFFFSIIIIIIAKFIYDSFLTNNTEKNWEKFKNENPHKAVAVENSKAFNLNPNAEIRTDGYYICKYFYNNYQGENSLIHFFLMFTKKGFVAFDEIENMNEWRKTNTNEFLKQTIFQVNEIDKIENTENLTNYKISNGGISMKFFDPNDFANENNLDNPQCFNEWHGSIIHNGLILSLDKSYFNDLSCEYEKENTLKNLKFDFNQVKF